MNIIELPVTRLKETSWNPNQMDERMTEKLRQSMDTYGVVIPLVVRPIGGETYEVLSGNQRLRVIRKTLHKAPCVIVDLNDADAMLLAQALNGIHGEDDLGMKGELLRRILAEIPDGKVLSLLPETEESLKALSEINQGDLAANLQAWENARTARLRHLPLQFTDEQLEVVEKALSLILPEARDEQSGNPNTRSNAMYLLCKFYLERRGVK
ncbi:ParB/RepB/Spo0J family partition protein [Chloroflexota bacterium]